MSEWFDWFGDRADWNDFLYCMETWKNETEEQYGIRFIWLPIVAIGLILLLVGIHFALTFASQLKQPLVSPKKLLLQLAKARKVSRWQLKSLRSLFPKAHDLMLAQLLLDSSSWTEEIRNGKGRGLYQQIFKS
jgi:glucan phosphoethanolaminetransferase (alkaline phosphatase superfamily)